jgi:hypothetical protein
VREDCQRNRMESSFSGLGATGFGAATASRRSASDNAASYIYGISVAAKCQHDKVKNRVQAARAAWRAGLATEDGPVGSRQ